VRDRQEWNRNLFRALTSKRLSRNKYFSKFSDTWFRSVHRRFRTAASLLGEAERLAEIPETRCWISREQPGSVLFHLHSPRLFYSRVVALQPYEWEWLLEQEPIQTLLEACKRLASSTG
jgi:hypothetical protein